jgi:hypothetical protein
VPAAARPKGTGVAALLKRFQPGGGTSGSSSDASTTPEGNASSSAHAAARSSGLVAASDKAPAADERPLSGVVEVASLDTLPPSKGAHSLLDPEETIANPFASQSHSRAATPQPSSATDLDVATPSAASESERDPARFSTASDAALADSSAWRASTSSAAPSDNFDPASAVANRFSMISLGSARPSRSSGDGWGSNKRDTLQPADVEQSEGQEGAGLLARQAARISRDSKARQSIDPARLKEHFERLQAGRRSSQGAVPAATSEEQVEQVTSSTSPADAEHAEPASAPDGASEEAQEDVVDWDFWGEVMASECIDSRSNALQCSASCQTIRKSRTLGHRSSARRSRQASRPPCAA